MQAHVMTLPFVIVTAGAACRAGNETPRTDATTGPAMVTVIASDYAFDAPDTIASGMTTFRLENHSDQFHMAQLIRLEEGKTLDEFLRAYGEAVRTVGPRPEWATRLGGPGGAAPHGESNATQYLRPGNYAWVCLMNPPPDRLPHVLKGMAHPFIVRPASVEPASRTPAQGDVVIQLVDYSFSISAPLTAGRQRIRIENRGAEPHEAGLMKLASGKTVEDLEAWLRNLGGPPPGSAVGGVSSLASNAEASFEVDLTPGDYVFFCLVTAPDGRPHTAHGMIQHVRVS